MKIILVLFLFAVLFGKTPGQNTDPVRIRAGGVELHYIEKGRGEPVILLHGGVGDYRAWNLQLDEFSKNHRVISYSRRYHYPNKNPLTPNYRSAETEAEDLLAFLRKLKLRRVHLVGLSYGALTALIFAVKHPKMVGSLVLAEPPAHQLIRDLPDGESVYQNFMNALEPVAESFGKGDDRQAMRVFYAALGRNLDKLPPDALKTVIQNAPAIKAINTSADPFPKISKEKLRQLKVPTLIVTGENTIEIHKLVDRELSLLLPLATAIVVPKAGHGTPRENPQFFNEAVLKFLTIQQIK